jgi:uncharacterized membrane protein YphA (DoxX/SURF4 family)
MSGWLGTVGEQLIVLFFLVTGLSNLTKARIANHIERMRDFGTPYPVPLFWVGILLQFAGCAMIELRWHPALGVACLILFTVAATGIFHRFWQKSDPVQRNFSRLTLLGNAAVLGGLLLLLERLR